MGRMILLIVAVSSLIACTPFSSRPVAGAEPVFYRGQSDAVFATVVQAISTSPGLDDSNGWIIMQSDRAGGFVRAETSVEIRAGLMRVPQGRYERHTLSVVISPVDESRTQVVIQGTRLAGELASRVAAALVAEHGIAN